MVRRSAFAALSFLALAVACGSSDPPLRTPAGARASCAADADCVVTSSSGCCACCKDAPHAIPQPEFARKERTCAAVDCAPCTEGIQCPKVEDASAFVAKCREGTCAAVRN